MGIYNDQLLLEKGLRTAFMKKYDSTALPADVMPMIMKEASQSDREKYGWLGQVPKMRLWEGSRKLSGLREYDYSIVNKKYEASIQIDNDKIEDDQYGHLKTRVGDLAIKAREFPRVLFFDALVAGETELCFDGQPFFDTAHVYYAGDPTTQSNLLTGTKAGTYPTAAEFVADFNIARAALEGFLDDIGEPMSEGNLQLMTLGSPNLRTVFDNVFSASLLSNSTNVLVGASQYMTSPRLSGADWYVMVVNQTLKPFIWQERRAPRFRALEVGARETDDTFMTDVNVYGVDARHGFGYGLWQYAVKVAY